jgi:ribose transport system ATP-binding protein
MTTSVGTENVVSLAGIYKRYPGVVALADVSLDVKPGEVHGLVGENGAGKSTLIKIIGGVEKADSGLYYIAGRPSHIESPRDARAMGISVLHQERSFIPTFTIGENVLLDEILSSRGMSWFRRKAIHTRAEEYLRLLELDLDPAGPVTALSAAQLQLIEIARALSVEARLLVLDEPTASIALQEASSLLRVVRGLRDRQVAVLYVSHKLEEIFEICDQVSVLRDGHVVARSAVRETSRADLIRLMVGREHVAESLPLRTGTTEETALEVRDLRRSGRKESASFKLRRGEILGWYGLVGAGRTELAHTIIGADMPSGGQIFLFGRPVRIRSVAQALRKYRLGYVSEDRQTGGLFLMHSVSKNVSAATWRSVRRRVGLIDISRERSRAEECRRQLAIRTPTVAQLVSSLSGGNKQKVSLGKWLVADPEILIIDEPTVGIDVRTKYEVHNLIVNLANQGVSIIVISSDLVEIIRLVDRILVFRGGAIIGEHVNTKDYNAMSQTVMADILGRASGPLEEASDLEHRLLAVSTEADRPDVG